MKKLYAAVLVVLALASVAVACVYLAKTAGTLPHFFPGYTAGSTHKHAKHALAFIGLAVILGLGAWVFSGPKTPARPTAPDQSADTDE